ncbi:TrbG/VirB9 family P-type conjugative transfer protein [Paraglaciecola sp. 20A4]|uniref:TrbG/VirB9 family P-type conjugative transfer protein n=1 Tax=Paraglaciecola sp. 20A4 TaxID=2687288 RepID=UPI00140E5F09|nr:TrbG/VirB9 family P-type conjugative transfer protein [Paraglaciecola sp. 20A4]
MNKLITLTAFSLFSLSASALDCVKIGHESGKTYDIEGTTNTFTHVILPENIMRNTTVIVGNSDLWTSDTAGPHIYIKPTSTQAQGVSTSLSAVGESGTSYDFKINRKKAIKNTCYEVTTGTLFSDNERQALSLRKNDSQDSTNVELARLYRDKYNQATRDAKEQERTAVLEALRRYRYQIYTRYDWDKPSKNYRKSRTTNNFIGDGFVSDIYDDGRFTYIRVHNQNKGIMIVEAELEGQTEIIEAKFDTLNKMYTIAGIFPKFTLKYADSEFDISRGDNSTFGEY